MIHYYHDYFVDDDDAPYIPSDDYFIDHMNTFMLYFLNDNKNYTWQGGDSSELEKRCQELTQNNLYSYDGPSYSQTKFLWKQMTIDQKLEFYEKTKEKFFIVYF
jgi:hypothetical protein